VRVIDLDPQANASTWLATRTSPAPPSPTCCARGHHQRHRTTRPRHPGLGSVAESPSMTAPRSGRSTTSRRARRPFHPRQAHGQLPAVTGG
jgi:hypothetical protein